MENIYLPAATMKLIILLSATPKSYFAIKFVRRVIQPPRKVGHTFMALSLI